MYSVIALTAIIAAVGLTLYYTKVYESALALWMGIVSFMVLYHFGLRILFGEITKKFDINYKHFWYKQRGFEPKLYKLLRVRKISHCGNDI